MKKKITKAERTRQYIVESTASIFNIKGYAGTSLADLTKATGLSKGSIYGNFSSKEEVAAAAFDYNHERIAKLLRKKSAKASSFYDKLMTYAQVYDRYSAANFPKGGCPLLNTAIEADDTNPVLRDKSCAAITSWKNNLIGLLRDGAKSGEFIEPLDAEQTALSMIALIEGGMMIAKATNKPANMVAVMKTFKLLLDSLVKP